MTDKELLEMAAKAAGIEVVTPTMLEYGKWNPLEDDGDALRLAVKLGMMMYICQPNDCIGVHITEINRMFKERHKEDPYAATRRAIVRAAAEITKGQQ